MALVCIHGMTDSGRTWDLVRPALEAEHDVVLTPNVLGHAGGPAYAGDPSLKAMADALETELDAAGLDRPHLVGNSLGGALVLELAARGRATTVTALAPAGGWTDDSIFEGTAKFFRMMHGMLQQAAPMADAIAATPEGRAQALSMTVVNGDHVPAELIAHQIRAAAACEILLPLLDWGTEHGLATELGPIDVPVQIVWGTEDKLLLWPSMAERFKTSVPDAQWVVLENVGHCPQLDVPEETARLINAFATTSRT